MRSVSFVVHPVPPFCLDLTAWAIRRRPNNAIDAWDGHTYRRAIVVAGSPVELEVTASGSPTRPTLNVTARGARLPSATQKVATNALDRALGVHLDLRAFYKLARTDPRLAELASRFRGVKPPRFPSVFEAVVNGVACQQLSLTVGIILLNRLARRCAPHVGEVHAFPRAEDIASLRPSDLRALGYSFAKARALLDLSRRVASGGVDLEALFALDNDAAIEKLLTLRGVGRWTAEYVLLRGLGRIDLFPGDDVGARTNLARWMKLRHPLDYDSVRRLARRWEPFAGFLYFHLLLRSLEEAGRLEPSARGQGASDGPPAPALERALERAGEGARKLRR